MGYELTWEKKGVYKRFTGVVKGRDYLRSQAEVFSDPRFDQLRYVINDLLAVEAFDYSIEDAEYAAAYNRGPSYTRPAVDVAYVTTDTGIVTLIDRVRDLSSYPLHVFPTLGRAREKFPP